jgi:multidrug efflux pump subunit AcrB
LEVWAGLRTVPSLSVDVDQAKSASLGLNPADVATSITRAVGSVKAVELSLFGRSWSVRALVDTFGWSDTDLLNRLKLRTTKGELVPMSAVAKLRRGTEPGRLERIDGSPAVSITATPAREMNRSQARSTCEELASQAVPQQGPVQYRLVWLRE